ncbi:MAG: Rieske 2Fe-2S domain-containing protein [Alphaproteobacteria bacterium]|nr:Rieske 2Fe-2S domain-containing protein [Alphaproteobacteria bacterium]
MDFQAVCKLDDLWEGEMEVFDIGDQEVLLVHAPGGEVRAYDPVCPHQDHPLVEGSLDGCVLTCAAHLWQFDVVTGAGVNPEGVTLRSFPVKVEDEVVMVALPLPDQAPAG